MTRRSLRFASLSDVLADVDRLERGHRTVGRWTLAQICRHLADSFHGSIDGFDLTRHRIKRWLAARPMLWYTVWFGIPRDYLVDPALTPPEGVELDASVERLRGAIERYENHRGPWAAHPLFGRMPRRVWDRIHRIHCAHHLGFAIPQS